MRKFMIGSFIVAGIFFQAVFTGNAATIYLKPDGNDGSDGSSWALAKKTLAGALAAAGSGDVVLATNGTYISTHLGIDYIRSGETVRSVNGPDYTAITKYDSMIPCIRVEGVLDGFTIRDGVTSSSYDGGGATVIGGVLVNCIVTNCRSAGDGGGVNVDSGGLVSNCVISGCSASAGGGGVYIRNGLVTGTTIENNSAGTKGGGVQISSTAGFIQNSIVRKNTAGTDGGGICGIISSVIRGCMVAGNQAGGNGGGVSFDGGTLESCTVVGNTASGNGAGVYATTGGSRLRNCIVYYNQSVDAYLSLSVYLYNSCYQTSVNSPNLSAGNSFTNAPEFLITGSGYGTNHVFGNYMLKTNSPCIDTGVNQSWMNGTNDLAGTNRIINSIVNMGAYEGVGTGKEQQTITFAAIPNQLRSARVTLSGTASSGLSVSFAVASGPAQISGGTTLTFTGVGPVSITASQAGNTTYDAAPNVIRSFLVSNGESFRLTAFALTNNAVVRWSDPYACAISNQNVMLRYNSADYPATTAAGTLLYSGTNRSYSHTGLTPGQTYYYSAFVSQNGTTFTNPP